MRSILLLPRIIRLILIPLARHRSLTLLRPTGQTNDSITAKMEVRGKLGGSEISKDYDFTAKQEGGLP